MESLFQRLGGRPAVEAAVDKFYDKILADDRTKDFFDGVDMDKQRKHQKAFLIFAFGGTGGEYNGRNMRDAHKDLVENQGIGDAHFDVVVELLGSTLAELGVAEELIGEVAQVAESVRADVLNR